MQKQLQWVPAMRIRHCAKEVHGVATILLLAGAIGTAHAARLETGNPDLDVSFDNQIRYNAGVRMQGVNPVFGKNTSYDGVEYHAKRHDLVMNRVDLFSEFDVIYQKRVGFRLSGSAWRDFAYGKSVESNPALGAPSEYLNDRYNAYTRRFVRGGSGELLDAFVFGNTRMGDVAVSGKAGKHTVYWGESLFSIFHGVSYGQAPLDLLKAATSPGIEAKELFMPIRQLSGQAQLTDTVSIAGQYYLDWKPSRLPPGGTYFSSSDAIRADRVVVATGAAARPYTTFPVGPDVTPESKRGAFGINLRWAPSDTPANFGFYYRRFNEIFPWGAFKISPTSPLPSDLHLSFADYTKLVGVSMATTVNSVSVGAELSYRRNAALASTQSYVVPSAGLLDFAGREGARGNTWHALVNAIYLLPATPLWEGGSLNGELVYSRLDSVTKNAALFQGVGYGGCPSGDKWRNCATKDYVGMQVGFAPQWAQVLPGVDLTMPTSLAYGLHGNAATINAGNQGVASWSIGLEGQIYNQYTMKVAYNDTHVPYSTVNGAYLAQNGSTAVANNHGWLSFTFKTSF